MSSEEPQRDLKTYSRALNFEFVEIFEFEAGVWPLLGIHFLLQAL
jgi:hypothetical protein